MKEAIINKYNLNEEINYIMKNGTELVTTRGKAYAMMAWSNLWFFLSRGAFILFLFTFIAAPVMVASGSMDSTLQTGDWALVVFPMSKNLNHEDIVMFTAEEVERFGEDTIVKRVIGLPGDVISMDDGVVTRNGVTLEEDYVSEDHFNKYGYIREFTIPDGQMLVLGDNRAASYDCEDIAGHTVPLAGVEGKVYELGWFGVVMGNLTSWRYDIQY